MQHELDHLDGVLFPDRVEDPRRRCAPGRCSTPTRRRRGSRASNGGNKARAQAIEAILLCARLEGMLTDPVYEGKSIAALNGYAG